MPEPLEERCEEAWMRALNRFDEHIWPLFEKRGYTKGEALIAWGQCNVLEAIEDLARTIEGPREPWDKSV